MRPLADLIDLADPALPRIAQCLRTSAHACELLAPSAAREQVLVSLQVTTRSHLGAVAYHSGGILIDDGWLRVLGSGHDRFTRNLRDWNRDKSPGMLLVADDAVGGFFALNRGDFGADLGNLYYWAPDSLAWEALGVGYGNFLEWALSDQLARFYDGLRWPGWQGDIAAISADHCMSFYPFLWTAEGSVQDSTRGVLGMAERFSFNADLARQLRGQ